MGTVNVAFFAPSKYVYPGIPLLSENVTSSASSADSSDAPRRGIASVCPDGNVRVAVGPNPTATAAGIRVVADSVLDIAVEAGDIVAVIDE